MKFIARLLLSVTVLCVLCAEVIYTQEPARPLRINSYYSPTLKAEFIIQKMRIPGHVFRAARIVSIPESDSPLCQGNLHMGDVITRLDGIPITNTAELDKHYGVTYVRFIKQGTNTVRNTVIDLDESLSDGDVATP